MTGRSPLTTQLKIDFFSARAVTSRVDRERRRTLLRGAAFVRTTASRSMRRGGARPVGTTTRDRGGRFVARRRATARSRPGQPPLTHEGSLKRQLRFAYDATSRTVVVGPETKSGSPVPRVLEFGGRIRSTRTVTGRRGRRKKIRTTVRIAARPYMAPALRAAVSRGVIARKFRNSVRGR